MVQPNDQTGSAFARSTRHVPNSGYHADDESTSVADSCQGPPCSCTAVLPKILHSNSCQRVPNRPLRPRRGRFGIFCKLECGIVGRTAAVRGVQCVLVTRESSTREYGSRVFHSSPCRPLLFILSGISCLLYSAFSLQETADSAQYE